MITQVISGEGEASFVGLHWGAGLLSSAPKTRPAFIFHALCVAANPFGFFFAPGTVARSVNFHTTPHLPAHWSPPAQTPPR